MTNPKSQVTNKKEKSNNVIERNAVIEALANRVKSLEEIVKGLLTSKIVYLEERGKKSEVKINRLVRQFEGNYVCNVKVDRTKFNCKMCKEWFKDKTTLKSRLKTVLTQE